MKEIRASIEMCSDSKAISSEVERLAEHFEISKSQIYAVTRSIRPKRKARADKGKRSADLMSDAALKQIAAWIVAYDVDPCEAYNLAALRGFEIPVSFETFQRYLREHEINAKTRRNGQSSYRRFQASRPGEIFQFDISGTKERWFDHKTRKIVTVNELEVSKNHPNRKATRVRIWRFKLVDDFSRRIFTRFYAVDKPNSSHIIDFLLQAYSEMGVPEVLYTDNDAVIKYGRMVEATATLSKALKDFGGYRALFHLPGNARATGKVERQHQEAEKSEKLIGLFLAEGRKLSLAGLNEFAVNKDAFYNQRIHRATGQAPLDRWNLKAHTVRKIDYEILKSAFLADRYEIKLKGDLSFDLLGSRYQLPPDQSFQNLYERQLYTRQKLQVIFAQDLDFYTLIDFDLNEYDITKSGVIADTAGDFKSNAASKGEKNRQALRAFAKEQAALVKEAAKEAPITYFDTADAENAKAAVAGPRKGILDFPKPVADLTDTVAGSLGAGRAALVENYAGKALGFWDAIREFEKEFSNLEDCKLFMDSVFADHDSRVLQSEIESALSGRIMRPKIALVG